VEPAAAQPAFDRPLMTGFHTCGATPAEVQSNSSTDLL